MALYLMLQRHTGDLKGPEKKMLPQLILPEQMAQHLLKGIVSLY